MILHYLPKVLVIRSNCTFVWNVLLDCICRLIEVIIAQEIYLSRLRHKEAYHIVHLPSFLELKFDVLPQFRSFALELLKRVKALR